MFRILLLILLGSMAGQAIAQTYIRGTITDEGGKPVANASIYFNNTQIGTKSNDQGNFALYAAAEQAEMVVSSIGYETLKITKPVHNTKYRIVLHEFQNTLNEVVIGQKVKTRAKWDALFFKLLMGDDPHSYSAMRILNPEVISFYYNGVDRKLTVVNSAPIIVKHPSLGYSIKIDLTKFEFDLRKEQLNRENTVFYEDDYRRAQEENIQMATNHSYYGSKRHFLKALMADRLKEEGFEVYQYHSVKNMAKEKAMLRINDLKLSKVLKGFNGTSITLSELFTDEDSIAHYAKLIKEKDYVSRTLDTIKAADLIRYDQAKNVGRLIFKDTILVKYQFKSLNNYLHTKVKPSHEYSQSWESLLVMVGQPDEMDVYANGLANGNNFLAMGKMGLSGLSQELPRDLDPTKPRFKAKNALLRDP